jgi:putative ABC transport system ATP-binding protein
MVRLRQIVRTFGEGSARVHALKGIDLDLLEGEYVAIRGASGSGKSTLLQIIGCLDAPTAGEYLLRGRDVRLLRDVDLARVRNEEIGFVFQSYHLLPDRSAEENVRLPLDYRRCRDEPHDPRQMLERVGLGDRSSHRPGELSGGERQRVAIARALVKRPRLIIFDEPTGNLDQRTTAEILDLLDELHCEENATLLLVTHDEKVADRADRELLIEDGRWVR